MRQGEIVKRSEPRTVERILKQVALLLLRRSLKVSENVGA
jgi:hypothetical protein